MNQRGSWFKCLPFKPTFMRDLDGYLGRRPIREVPPTGVRAFENLHTLKTVGCTSVVHYVDSWMSGKILYLKLEE